MNEKGNVALARDALAGMTGAVAAEPVPARELPDSFVVMARLNRELDTVDSLRRNNVAAYWPSYSLLRPSRSRAGGFQGQRWKRAGIIPGYVFTPLDPHLDFEQLLRRIVGAIDIVRTFSGNAWLIPDRYIRDLRKIEIGLNTPLPAAVTAHTFKIGQKVRFTDALVGDWPPGTIITLAPEGRISVEVDLMGRKVPVTVLPHQIERM